MYTSGTATNLSLNPVSGIITGSATTVGTTDHLITAGTAAGNLTLTLRVVIDHLCEAECIEAPAQWLGPIALRADACGDTHPIAGAVAHSGLPQFSQANCMGTANWTPGAAQDNMCPTDPGGSCVASNCNGGFQFRVDANAGCHAGPSQSGVDQWITLNYGDCTFSTSHTAEGVSFPDAFNVCAPSAVAGVCPDDKACQPALGSGRRCVYQHGNVASCPSAYPTRVPLYTGYTDTRGCTPAGCSYTAGTCTFTAYTGNSGCGGTPHTYDCGSFNYSICTGLGTFTGATLAQTGTPTLTGNAPTGTVAPSGVLTVCCAN